jgi:hypothetical protein
MMVQLAQKIQDGNHNQKGLFDSVVGQIKTHEKRWIVDVDTTDVEELAMVMLSIELCKPEEPEGGHKVIATIPTKNGYHVITKRFDVIEFKKKHPEVDIQKKNPTLLYYPESLES